MNHDHRTTQLEAEGGHHPVDPGRVSKGLRLWAVLLAAVAVAGFALVWRALVGSVRGQRLEGLAFEGATRGQNTLWGIAEPVLDMVSVGFVVLGTATAVGIALARRRWQLAAQVAVLVGGANVSTQVLKKMVLERPDLEVDSWSNSLPSGHTTVAASVSIALVLAAPRRLRPLVAILGAAYTAATGISTLVGQWHRPSDVIAALLVVLFWGALVSVVSLRSALDPTDAVPERGVVGPRATGTAWAVLLLSLSAVVAGAAAAWAVRRIAPVLTSAEQAGRDAEVVAYVGGAFGVVAVTALVFALLLALRQAVARPR